MIDVTGHAAASADAPLEPTKFQCGAPGASGVQIGATFCGVCHSDTHQAKNEWGNSVYPCTSGHEIVGRAVRVGCTIDSCRTCDACKAGAENYCYFAIFGSPPCNGSVLPKAKSPTGENMYGRDNTFDG